MTGLVLFAVGLVAGLLGWLGLVVLPRRVRAIEAVRAFAARRGALLSGAGIGEPMRVVGRADGRAFSLSFEASWLFGDVLLLAVDCASDAEGIVEGAIEARADDEALAARWHRPSADVLDRLDAMLDALTELAATLERERPAGPGDE